MTSKDKVDVYVRDAARENEETKLEIRGQDIWKRNTLVYHGSDLVMQLHFLKYITSFVPFSANQWDVAVAQGFEFSLACTIVVYLGSTLYDNSKFTSNYGLEAANELNAGRGSQKRQIRRVPLTTVVGASAVLGAAGSTSAGSG
ncbi:hypothetical protein MBLNU13_g01920t1 [Cladosporium sp. NU13]